jgi:hypothetical protein
MRKKTGHTTDADQKMGPKYPNCQPTCGNGGPIFVGPAKLGYPAGRTPLPKRISAVHAGFGVRNPTQTNYFKPFRHLNGSVRWRCP